MLLFAIFRLSIIIREKGRLSSGWMKIIRVQINLFQLVRNPGKCNASDDTALHYNESDDWPAHPPVGLWFKYGVVDDFIRE